MKTINDHPFFSIFSEIDINLSNGFTSQNLDKLFQSVNQLLEFSHDDYEEVLQIYLKDYSAVHEISNHFSKIDHIGLLIPNDVPLNTIIQKSRLYGFGKDYKTFPSVVISKQLAEIAQKEVPTTIFKNFNKFNQAVEIFIPKTDKTFIQKIIAHGWGNHIAFKLDSMEAMNYMQDFMKSCHVPMPDFMNGMPIINEHEKSYVMYYMLDGTYRALVEFIYIEPE